MDGFTTADTDTLLTVRSNLLAGVDKVAATLDDGTFHVNGPKGQVSPAQAGTLTLMLLARVDAELVSRGEVSVWPTDLVARIERAHTDQPDPARSRARRGVARG